MAVSPYIQPELLNEWGRYMEADGRPEWWFNQVSGEDAEISSGATVYIQFERDFIAQGLVDARANMENYLRSPIAPRYVTETLSIDECDTPLPYQYLQTKWRNVIEFGERASTLLEADVNIVYSSVALPNIDDTATITLTDTETDPDEIQVFFRVADGADSAGDEYWRIYPLRVVRTNASTITITGHRSLFVQPSIWGNEYTQVSGLVRNFATTTIAGDFITQVDIYRVYTDTTNGVTVKGGSTAYNNADDVSAIATPRFVDADNGIFQARFDYPSATSGIDTVELKYLAGFPLVNQRIDRRLAIPTIRLSNTYLPEKIKPIYDITFGRFARDREATPRDELQMAFLNNPFGLKRGQVLAWREVLTLTKGFRIGAV